MRVPRAASLIAPLKLVCLLAVAPAAFAAPYVPASGDQVIERLPSRGDPRQQELQRLRADLSATPNDPAKAAVLARRYVEVGRTDGDPRYFGYAQAALAPWWHLPDPPTEVRILRATLLQGRHQFDEALQDLDAVLRTDSRDAQAWLTRATIEQVQAEYAKAKASCSRLQALAPELVTVTCMANAASLSGQAEKVYPLLESTLKRHADADPGIRSWAMTLLAEMAVRLGNAGAAETHFRGALALAPGDTYLLGAYADFLLDQNRAAEAESLLARHGRVDGLLLRHALALRARNAPQAGEQTATLRTRFTAAAQRGSDEHLRERARFELGLMNNPSEALRLASENWKTQKEPADARILLEAALAAGDRGAAKPVLQWMQSNGVQDVALAALAGKLGGRS